MESEFIIFSDLHLEAKTEKQIFFIEDLIKNQIDKIKEKNKKPILLLAGDINNGVFGIEWAKKFEIECFYTAGNHEFWDNDFYEVKESLANFKDEKVKFLNNDFAIVDDNVIIGTTLWTDVGLNLNKDLESFSLSKMNDNFYITAKNWYESEENRKIIAEKYTDKRYLNNKLWNIFIEREENQKAIDFLKSFNIVFQLQKTIHNLIKSNKDSLSSSFRPISKEEFKKNEEILLSYKNEITLREYLEKVKKITSGYPLRSIDFNLDDVKEIEEKIEDIFQKCKKINLFNKKLIVMSHHLPFYEELLIGRDDYFLSQSVEVVNEINESLFLINKGVDYPYHNYFWRISKGEFQKKDDISAIIHYCNNGSEVFSSSFLESIDLWVHGHEHHYSYEDMLKGFKMVCNPLGHNLSVFDFKENKITFNADYLRYHKVQDAEIDKRVEEVRKKITKSIVLKDKGVLEEEAVLFVLKYGVFKSDYIKLLEESLNEHKDLLLTMSEAFINDDDGKVKYLKMQSKAMDFNINKINLLEEKFEKALSVRLDTNYSIFKNKYGLINKQNVFVMTDKLHNIIVDDLELIEYYYAKFIFQNMQILNSKLKFLKKMRVDLEKFDYCEDNTQIINLKNANLTLVKFDSFVFNNKIFNKFKDKYFPVNDLSNKNKDKFDF